MPSSSLALKPPLALIAANPPLDLRASSCETAPRAATLALDSFPSTQSRPSRHSVVRSQPLSKAQPHPVFTLSSPGLERTASQVRDAPPAHNLTIGRDPPSLSSSLSRVRGGFTPRLTDAREREEEREGERKKGREGGREGESPLLNAQTHTEDC